MTASTKAATKATQETAAPGPQEGTENAPEPVLTHDPAPAASAPERVPTIVQAMSRVMTDVSHVSKGQTAPGNIGGFQFRGVDAVVNAVAPALRRHGVVVTPEVLAVERVTTATRAGNSMLNVYVTTRFTFHGPAGDTMSTTVLGEAADSGDKATSKAQSVALRVALLQALMLPTDEPDPDSQGYERGSAETATQRPAREQRPQGEPSQPGLPSHAQELARTLAGLDEAQKQWVRQHWPEGVAGLQQGITVEGVAKVTEVLALVPPL